MHFFKNRNIIVVLLIILLSSSNVYSVDYNNDVSGFVINSPLYNSLDNSVTTITNDDIINTKSFNYQLGLVDLNKQQINNDLALLQAISDSNYSVTPGDSFQVIYLDGKESKELLLQVDSQYKLNIPLIGTIDAKGKNIPQITDLIKSSISKYYSFSSPQVNFVSMGIFAVDVIGEVTSSSRIIANGLTRLSDVVYIANDRANTRDIQIKDINGKIEHYDLFLALKKGQIDQNPLLEVGDTVILRKADKQVNIVGSVYNPGTYQIKSDESLLDVIDYYGDGLLTKADKNNIYISRYDVNSNSYNEIKINLAKDFTLLNLDTIVVPSVKINRESVYIEGAISNNNTSNITALSQLTMVDNKIIYNFYPKETLEEMLETISPRFLTNSDLAHSYLIRNDERISINIINYLANNVDDNFYLQAGDKIIIPYDNKYINVQGGIEKPGTFNYVENKKLEYYISLAGGYSQDATDTITITNSKGEKIDLKSDIPSNSTIYVKKDTFKSDLALIASIVTIIASTVSIIDTTVGLFK